MRRKGTKQPAAAVAAKVPTPTRASSRQPAATGLGWLQGGAVRAPWIAGFVLVAATLLVYAPGLRNGFAYDDYWLVETNPALRAPGSMAHYLGTALFAGTREAADGVWAGGSVDYWRPFIKLALLLQFRAFGANASGYHAVSLIVHVATVLLAFVWLRRRVMALWPAALGAALFALHPARVESVSWVSGSTDLWMAFWVVLGLVVWERGTRAAAIATSIAFGIAVLAKETALVVPVCLAVDAWASGATPRRAVRAVLGPALALGFFVVLWIALLHPAGGRAFGRAPRILASVGSYVAQTFFPLHPSSQVGLVSADGHFEFGIGLLALGAVTLLGGAFVAVAAARKPVLRPWFADAAWFAVPLAPVSNVVAIGYTTLIAERFLTLPLLGGAALVARALRTMFVAVPRLRVVVGAGACVVCGGLALVSASYVPQWRGNDTLWRYEARLHPDSPNLQLYLARAEMMAGRTEAAMRAAGAAYARARTPDMRAWAAVAWAASWLRTLPDAEQERLTALRSFYDDLSERGTATLDANGTAWPIAPTSVIRGQVRNAVANARAMTHARTGSLATAEALFADIARHDSNPANVANWARVVALQGRCDEALAALAPVRRANPSDAELAALDTAIRRAQVWANEGETKEPRAVAARAVAARARLWLDVGSLPLALRTLETLDAAAAQAPEVTAVRALTRAADGRPDEARTLLVAARTQDPSHAALYDRALAELEGAAPVAPKAANVRGNVDALFH